MQDKWLAILAIGIVLSMFLPVIVESYQSGECKKNAIQMKYTAEEIQKICK